jgi:hypothetical protein
VITEAVAAILAVGVAKRVDQAIDLLKEHRAARGGARYSDDLVKAAQSKFPGKAGKIEQHHVTPKYLGGDPKGPTVPIDAAYHQEITKTRSVKLGRMARALHLRRICRGS